MRYSLCGVVVTYHPGPEMVRHISRILPQVSRLIVVDNGSDLDELTMLRNAALKLGFFLIENMTNLGIAEGLNKGVKWAQKHKFEWVVLFDQDSQITDGFMEAMFTTWETHTCRKKVCSVHPRYVDPDSGREPAVRRARDGGPFVSMTSGALMPIWIFETIGYFRSDFFIDLVDTEYCLRIRANGFLVADSREAILRHRAGEPREISLWGFRARPSAHNALRRYYISRNRILVYRSYWSHLPRWVMQSLYWDFFRETIKCLLFEDNRMPKICSFLLGTWHGLLDKTGPHTKCNTFIS